jgi:TusA-related sulfurtransferase
MSEVLDCLGMACPKPVLKVAIKARTMDAGSTLEVHADCESFAEEIKKWCADTGHVLLSVVDKGSFRVATVRF